MAKRSELRKCKFTLDGGEWLNGWFHRWTIIKIPVDTGDTVGGEVHIYVYQDKTVALVEDQTGHINKIEIDNIRFSKS